MSGAQNGVCPHCLCSLLDHPLQSECSPAQTGLQGTQDIRWLSHLLWWSEPSQEDTFLLVGKVPRCLEPETGVCPRSCVASACPRSCVASAVCSLTLHSPRADLCRLVSEGPGTQDGSLTSSGSQSPPGRPLLLFSGRESSQMSGTRNGVCPRSCVASAVRTLTCADWSLRDPGHKV